MKQKTSAKIILLILGGILTILLVILVTLPALDRLVAVKVTTPAITEITQVPAPDKPEEVPVTVFYVMEKESKKISSIYIEIFPVGEDTVTYLELPADTKVHLSDELYKSLQSYAPELPQYLKMAAMAESFSTEYGMTGCNRIVSEVLGYSLTEYVRCDAESWEEFRTLPGRELSEQAYFDAYASWIESTSSGRTEKERWIYYESRKKIENVIVEKAPGTQEKDGYLLSGKRSKERLEELIRQNTAVQR